MRALETDVVDAVWAAIEPLLPPTVESIRWAVTGPGCRTGCAFWGLLIRLTTGSVVGRHRSDPGASGVGHDAASPP